MLQDLTGDSPLTFFSCRGHAMQIAIPARPAESNNGLSCVLLTKEVP